MDAANADYTVDRGVQFLNCRGAPVSGLGVVGQAALIIHIVGLVTTSFLLVFPLTFVSNMIVDPATTPVRLARWTSIQ